EPAGNHRDRDRAAACRHRHRAARTRRGRQRLRAGGQRTAAGAGRPGALRLPARARDAGDHQQRLPHARLVRHPGQRTGAARGRIRPSRIADSRRRSDRAREGARHRCTAHRGRRLLAGLRDGAVDGPAPPRAPGRHRRHVGLPPAGRHHRSRAQPCQCADAHLHGAWQLRQRGAGRPRARILRAAAQARLRRQLARVPDGAHREHGGDRRPQRLAAQGPGAGV
ncbi:MAG: probable carboxylesterase, partial [uncultured Ramlibacter sp.]